MNPPNDAESPMNAPRSRARGPAVFEQTMTFIGALVVCFGAAALGAAATSSSVTGWYREIVKPAWTPPDWVFGPVWTTLYLMMSISVWLVWRSAGWKKSLTAMVWFAVQLALNTLWSVIFFGLRSPGWAFAEILLLAASIAVTISCFRHHSRPASLLLLPYFGWSCFAVALNFTIWRLNV